MSMLNTDHCENCGCASRNIMVVDGVLTCNKCVSNRNNRFSDALSAVYHEETETIQRQNILKKKK
jgi:hypothetical protein